MNVYDSDDIFIITYPCPCARYNPLCKPACFYTANKGWNLWNVRPVNLRETTGRVKNVFNLDGEVAMRWDKVGYPVPEAPWMAHVHWGGYSRSLPHIPQGCPDSGTVTPAYSLLPGDFNKFPSFPFNANRLGNVRFQFKQRRFKTKLQIYEAMPVGYSPFMYHNYFPITTNKMRTLFSKL